MTLTSRMRAAVKNAMRKAGFENDADLANRIEMRPATVSEILNGKRDPRFSTVQKIARACNCTVSELIGEEAMK